MPEDGKGLEVPALENEPHSCSRTDEIQDCKELQDFNLEAACISLSTLKNVN